MEISSTSTRKELRSKLNLYCSNSSSPCSDSSSPCSDSSSHCSDSSSPCANPSSPCPDSSSLCLPHPALVSSHPALFPMSYPCSSVPLLRRSSAPVFQCCDVLGVSSLVPAHGSELCVSCSVRSQVSSMSYL